MFLDICMQFHCVLFALSRQINKQKCAKTIDFLCAGNEIFVTYKLLFHLGKIGLLVLDKS